MFKIFCNNRVNRKFGILSSLVVFTCLLGVGAANAAFMDRVLVIVNDDVITQSEYDHRMATVKGEIMQRNNTAELPEDLGKQLLDGMVSDRLQIQEAQRRGIKIGDEELNMAIQRFAAQQNMSEQQLAQQVTSQGQSYKRFRESVRESLTISRLTDYYASVRVVVPDYEIDGFIAQNKLADTSSEYQIAHILIKNPEQNLARAEEVINRLNEGMSFQQAVLNYSEATDAQDGGLIGWRKLDQLPEVFASAIKNVQVGGTTEILQSANGLHILKLLDMKGDRQEIIQSRVRHIFD